MPKKPSAETELRRVKAELKRMREAFDVATANTESYRRRATRAEQDKAWLKDELEGSNRRFDLLLERTPKAEV